ncbi:hypothetical protein B9G69_004535 [Bdellovibrio sp. SKB1291214]|uniref:hypothetical protein n=1 Tax=Bdellovibrio sp. SKB1291214 TaxID=1732569 RepID=UPI001C3C563A|nr:hypothetical protein [Bdellovibrio sp. SKB1291214]UYL09842.1 hypothetical protein B9G69_004535 [Bdellovibrio sp. SKB1291214]
MESMVNSFTGLKYMRSAIRGLTILAALSFVAPAFAANPSTSTMKPKAPVAPKAPESPWTFVFNLETASNMMKDEMNGREAQTALEAVMVYKFNKITSLKISTALYKDHTGPQDAGFDNSTIGLGFTTPLATNIDWKNSITAILPTNRKAQDQSSLQGTAALASTLVYKNLFWGSSATTGISVARNFHEYNMTADGGYNIRNTAAATVGYTLPLFGNFALDTLFKYTEAWLYNDDNRMKFLFSADLSYEFTPHFSAYIGTSNEGSALKPNGVDSNIEIFNDTSSVIKAGITLSI